MFSINRHVVFIHDLFMQFVEFNTSLRVTLLTNTELKSHNISIMTLNHIFFFTIF